jgi:hypothetical protein
MAGPGVRFGKRTGTVIFVRVLAGLVRDRASIAVLDVDISESNRLAPGRRRIGADRRR